MPKGPQGQKRLADAVGNAVHVMKIATGEIIDLLRGQEPYKFKWTSVQPPLAAAEWTVTLRGRTFALARRVASGQCGVSMARRLHIDDR